MEKASALISKARQVHRTQGLAHLLRRGLAFAFRQFFAYDTYYLYEDDGSGYRRLRESDVLPRVEGVSFRVIRTNEEAAALESRGFIFRECIPDARERLAKGAIAFCTFVGSDLATVTWLATTQQAQDSLNEPPVKVDFARNEAWCGGSWTNPRYRRARLHTYNSYWMIDYCYSNGVVRDRYAIAKRNAAALGADDGFGNTRYGEGRLLKLLWWRSWNERPLPPQSPRRH